MMKNPEDCKKVDRSVDGPVRARIFEISQLLEMYKASRQYSTGPMLRAWTYILISCCLFLRKSEAVNLKIGDIEVSSPHSTPLKLSQFQSHRSCLLVWLVLGSRKIKASIMAKENLYLIAMRVFHCSIYHNIIVYRTLATESL